MDSNWIANAADNAADYIERYGHQKFDIGGCGRSACIWGAIAWGNGKDWIDHNSPVMYTVAKYLGYTDDMIGFAEVIVWNNAPERTADEVITVLRDVATKYRSDEYRSGA